MVQKFVPHGAWAECTWSSWISLSRRSTIWSCCCFSAFSRASRFQGSGDRLSLDVSSSLLMVIYCRSRLSIVLGCCCGSSSLITVSTPNSKSHLVYKLYLVEQNSFYADTFSLLTCRVGGTGRGRNGWPRQARQFLWSGWGRLGLRLWGDVWLRRGHRGMRVLVVRGRHGSSIVMRLDGHDGIGPDLTQLPLLLSPLPFPGNHHHRFHWKSLHEYECRLQLIIPEKTIFMH